jgi:putative DNA primase/helicase
VQRYGPKKKAFYKLYADRARSGAEFITGYFGIWGELDVSKIAVEWAGIDVEERERLTAQRAAAEAAEQVKAAGRAKFAANRAREQWKGALSSKPKGGETYLDRKGVVHEAGLRFLADGTLLVPAIRYDVTVAQEQDEIYTGPPRLVGLQKITPGGDKRFNKGMAKAGAAARLGKAPGKGDLILVAEGVATALSLRMATARQFPVFVAFDAGNLLPVGKILRALYPASTLLFCADDDAYLVASMNRLLRENHQAHETVKPPATALRIRAGDGDVLISADVVNDGDGVPGIVGAVTMGERVVPFNRVNAGRVFAHRAAAEVGNASVVFPAFAKRELPVDPDAAGEKLTDFNDLHVAEGLAAVTLQLDVDIRRAAFNRDVAAAVKQALDKSKRENKTERKAAREPPAAFDWDGFFERFTLIYPSDTVYDAKLEVICKLSHISIAFGSRVVQWWLESPRRRTVTVENVVFDPEGKSDPAITVNLFRGLPKREAPPGARCEELLALLQYLCGEAGQDQAPVTDWVLNWLAYPLQHVGAKMATAIVMHGSEGTGKNLFFNAISECYGRYACLITQTQLESAFNGWMSQRLFVVANEVISRQELRHHVGRLKNMVTEPRVPIDEKNMPVRWEDNHMNMAFLTNELQALQISPGDRRYMIIRTPDACSQAFYDEVLAEVAAGGSQALHQFLLARDLGDFGAHTKPLLTSAKEALIELGLSSPQQFWQELHEDLLGVVPYAPALWGDLYRLYQVWCVRNGVKNPRQSNHFGQEFMSMNGVRRLKVRIADPDKKTEIAMTASQLPQRMVYAMGSRPEDVDEGEWLRSGVRAFRFGLREYLRDRGASASSARDEDDGQ